MRIFSSNINTLIASGNMSVFYMISTYVPTANLGALSVANSVVEGIYTVIKETTASTDIIMPGLGTFYCDSGVSMVEGPRQSSSVDRETYTLSYIDPEFNKRSLFEIGLTGAKIEVRVGFYNTLDYTLGSTPPGKPFLNSTDTVIAYGGVVDTHGYTIDPEGGNIIVVVECSSPMASLGLVRSFYTSRESMKQINSADTAFDQVSVNQSKTTYLWGKA
jgi:hypothetical protein